ncbi:hypothetical protein NEUTE2DRAFT_69597 [Neurospora tetrasperma FGSC 2509]|nr:hypothetical protein NEUTE2DRAFT_69597 [Neurospora tetrasperma FGSC 2509]
MYQAAVRSLSRCCHKGACLSRATENDGSACNDGNRSVSVPEQVRRGRPEDGGWLWDWAQSNGVSDSNDVSRKRAGVRMVLRREAEVELLRARAMEWNLNGSGEWKRGQSRRAAGSRRDGWTSCRCRNVSRRKSRVGSRRLELPPCWVRVVRDWQECPGTAVEKRG